MAIGQIEAEILQFFYFTTPPIGHNLALILSLISSVSDEQDDVKIVAIGQLETKIIHFSILQRPLSVKISHESHH